MDTVDSIRQQFVGKLVAGDHKNGMLEIIGASFLADDITIFGQPNYEYINNEIKWYESQSLNVYDIPGGPPKIWRQIASSDGLINSNYGFLFFGSENGDQFHEVVRQLLVNNDTRRATAVYTRPSIHEEWNKDGMSDFICTNAVHYVIRDGRLHLVVQMRSNDAIFGYRNDYAWQKHTQFLVLDELEKNGLKVQLGDIIWQASSLHVYSRHFNLVNEYIESGNPYMKVGG